MQNEAGVKIPGQSIVRDRAVEHVEKIGGMAQARIRWYGFEVVANSVPGGHDGSEFGNQAQGHAGRSITGHIFQIRVILGQNGNRCLQNVHGQRIFRARFEKGVKCIGYGSLCGKMLFEGG